ncbi:hypothetical protein [Streptosporangium canum]|uniref:hypothetical protein n=1 Tax=Streptosporangium canum TaxID=324952 RepID=UPI0037BA6260
MLSREDDNQQRRRVATGGIRIARVSILASGNNMTTYDPYTKSRRKLAERAVCRAAERAMTKPRNDTFLWSAMLGPLKAAGVGDVETMARTLVALVRQANTTKSPQSWGPHEDIPDHVLAVYDLDGDIWDRTFPHPETTLVSTWRMRHYDSARHDINAAQTYGTPELLLGYGPLTDLMEMQ